MNKQRVRQVLDSLTEENHDQMVYMGLCGTKFCIAGHAVMIWGTDEEKEDLKALRLEKDPWSIGQTLLGLTDVEAGTMFAMGATREEQEQCYEEGIDA